MGIPILSSGEDKNSYIKNGIGKGGLRRGTNNMGVHITINKDILIFRQIS